MSLESVRYSPGKLEVLNQLRLPHETVYESVMTADDGWHQIRTMKVRGAPAIAIVAALSLAVELHHLKEGAVKRQRHFKDLGELVAFVKERWDHLKTSRPTAVNLFDTAGKSVALVEEEVKRHPEASVDEVIDVLVRQAEAMLQSDIADNKSIGKHGAEAIKEYLLQHMTTVFQSGPGVPGKVEAKPPQQLNIVTVCNTGSLATGGYGTALGVIRALHEQASIQQVYCLETRPYNQGSRLTAYELVHEKIPATLITDSMAAALMSSRQIHAVVVGADRVAGNGDTANKIGTYQLAIVAQYHTVPFYVCAPVTSIDASLSSGAQIPIEERKAEELIQVSGAEISPEGGLKTPLTMSTVQVAAQGISVWNPAFDVTPAHLIEAIVTERGLITKKRGEKVFRVSDFVRGKMGEK